MRYALKEAGLQNPVLRNTNGIKRPVKEGEAAQHVEARDQQSFSGRCRRNRRKEYALTRGGLGLGLVFL